MTPQHVHENGSPADLVSVSVTEPSKGERETTREHEPSDPLHPDGWTRMRKRRGSEHPDRFPPAQQVRVISTDEPRCS